MSHNFSKGKICAGRSLLAIFTILTLCISCAGIKPEPPEVGLAGVTISGLTLSHANILATLEVYNPNAKSLKVERVQYTMAINGVNVARGLSLEEAVIPANGTGHIKLNVRSPYWDLVRVMGMVKKGRPAEVLLKGSVKLGGFGFSSYTFPFERRGTLSLEGLLRLP